MATPGQGFPTRPSMMILLIWIIHSIFWNMHTHGLPHRTLENQAFESIDPINDETRSDDTESTSNYTYGSSPTFPIESVAAMLRHFYNSSEIDGMAHNLQYDPERSDDNDDADQFQDFETSLLVKNALVNGELLDSERWVQINEEQNSRIVQRDTSAQQEKHSATSESHESGMSQPVRTGQRRMFSYQEDSHSTATKSQAQSDGRIIFPDDDMIVPSMSTKIGIDPMCAGQTFCENVLDYPERLINQAIRRDGRVKMWEVEDQLIEVVPKIDDAGDEVLLCRASEQLVRPKAALNKDNQWVRVVNQDNLKQALKIETCNKENARCEVIDGFADGYQTSCKQKYIYRPVATYKREPNDSATIDLDTVRLPSSCCCHVRFVGHPLLRMAFGMSQSKKSLPKSASPSTASTL